MRKLGDFERVLCAAPEYLERHGAPRAPEELAQHTCITIMLPGRTQWAFDTPSGRRVIKIESMVNANNNDCVLQLALMGMGIAHLNDFVVGKDLRAGRLVPLLTEFHCADKVPMHALYAHDRHRLPRVAAMLDFLVESFAYPPWRRATPSSARAARPGRPARAR